MKEIELSELIGTHLLSGVDETTEMVKHYYDEEKVTVFRFVLDGKTYKVYEDPNDGYRSSMDKIIECDEKVSHTFEPQEVVIRMKGPDEDAQESHDAIECIDIKNGKIVLEAGTGNHGDYYPYFIGSFYPQNLSINESLNT